MWGRGCVCVGGVGAGSVSVWEREGGEGARERERESLGWFAFDVLTSHKRLRESGREGREGRARGSMCVRYVTGSYPMESRKKSTVLI